MKNHARYGLASVRALVVVVIFFLTMIQSSEGGEVMTFENDSPLLDAQNVIMTNGLVTIWKAGGNGTVEPYLQLGTDDAMVNELTFLLTTNPPGCFYFMFEPTAYGVQAGDRFFARVFNSTSIVSSTSYADVGLPPHAQAFYQGESKYLPSFATTQGIDQRNWQERFNPPELQFDPSTIDLGSLEVGVTVQRSVPFLVWGYNSLGYSNADISAPFDMQSSPTGALQGPASFSLTIACCPLSTGLQQQALNIDSLYYGYPVTRTATVTFTGVITDTDADGISDVWESSAFGDLTSCSNLLQDFDGDGASDSDEWLAGTDPKDPSSAFAGNTSASTNGSAMELEWPSVGTAQYRIRAYYGSLATPGTTIMTHIPGTPPLNRVTLPLSATQAFFRVSIER